MEIPVKCLEGAGLDDIGSKLYKSLENVILYLLNAKS